jgi:hypothetical protein
MLKMLASSAVFMQFSITVFPFALVLLVSQLVY